MFKETVCPVCHEKIQVPDDKEKVLCMFCGAELLVKEVLSQDVQKLDASSCEMLLHEVSGRLADLIHQKRDPLEGFKKDLFMDVFMSFYDEHLGLLQDMEKVFASSDDAAAAEAYVVSSMMEAAQQEIDQFRSKSGKNQKLIDYNFFISVYIIPSVRKFAGAHSEEFADTLVSMWNQNFSTAIGKSTVEEINGGFRRKLCYITTAVCGGIGKDADCYELRLLKEYRDGYMESTPEGHAMVEEYYDIAPTIVKRMEREPEAKQCYQQLYERYISNCIHMIEKEQFEDCKELYRDMVQELKTKYLN